jgi:hypothetical protein
MKVREKKIVGKLMQTDAPGAVQVSNKMLWTGRASLALCLRC